MSALAHEGPVSARLTRVEQRALLASTPPATPWLRTHPAEDLAVRKTQRGELVTRRFDVARSERLPEEHLGAIRLFDRGLIEVDTVTAENASWRWRSLRAETEGLRMLRHRGLGFQPYNMGYRGLEPATMSGPELVTLLAWHYRHTGVRRVDINTLSRRELQITEHHPDGTSDAYACAPVLNIHPFEQYTRRIHAHRDNTPDTFDLVVLAALFTNLVRRVGVAHFGAPRLSVDLNSWHLLAFEAEPASYTETLPLDVQDALTVFGAPCFATVEEFVAWASESLVVTVMCTTYDEDGRAHAGARRHTIRLDPYTGDACTVPSEIAAQHAELEAVHLLTSLSGGAKPRCMYVQDAWRSTGVLTEGPRLRWSQVQSERVLAAHLIAGAIQSLS